MKFIRCFVSICSNHCEEDCGEGICDQITEICLVPLSDVVAVHFHYDETSADVIETNDGRMAECFHETIPYPSIEDCVVDMNL